MENNGGNDRRDEMLKQNYIHPKEFPAGYKFCPTDYELVVEYLNKKIKKVPLDRHLHIREVNIYDYNPMELSCMYKLERETEWYFFTPRFKKYANGSRPDRNAHGGYWKPTETDEPVKDDQLKRIAGYKRTLTFYLGLERHNNNKKTEWRMHEYTLEKKSSSVPNCHKLNEWVLVKIYKKRGNAEKEGKDQNAVDEFGLANNSGYAQTHYDQAQIYQAPQTLSGSAEMLNQACFLPPFPSPILSLPPLVELPPFPQQHFFNHMGHYYPPNYPVCLPSGPQLNQTNQLEGAPPPHQQLYQTYEPSGPLRQQAFGLNEATNLERHDLGHVNPVTDNGMQLQQQIAQLGECSNNQMVFGGCQSSDLGLRIDPSYHIVIEEDKTPLMDLLLADEVSLKPESPKAFPPWQ